MGHYSGKNAWARAVFELDHDSLWYYQYVTDRDEGGVILQVFSTWLPWQPKLLANLYKIYALSFPQATSAIIKTWLIIAQQMQS